MANALKVNLKHEMVLVKKGSVEIPFLCSSGFGCSPTSQGTTILGIRLDILKSDTVEGTDVIRLLDKEERKSFS